MEQLASGLNKQKVIEKVGRRAGGKGSGWQQRLGAGRPRLQVAAASTAAAAAAAAGEAGTGPEAAARGTDGVGAEPFNPAPWLPCCQAVFDELCAMLDGGDPKKTELKKGKTNVVMFVGLQGEQLWLGSECWSCLWACRVSVSHSAMLSPFALLPTEGKPKTAVSGKNGTACLCCGKRPALPMRCLLTPRMPPLGVLPDPPCRCGQDDHMYQVCVPVQEEGIQAGHGEC